MFQTIQTPLAAAMTRFDSWVNALTRVGLDYGKNAFTFVNNGRLTDQMLEDLYNGDPYAATICHVFPDESIRQGFALKLGSPEVETATKEALDGLGGVEKLAESWTWARCFGGGVVFVGADDGQDPAEPLREDAIRAVRFLTVLDKRELMPQRWYTDPLDARFGTPKTYRFAVSGGGGGTDTREVHQTRLIRFDGARTTRRERARNNGWGLSELQRTFTALQQFNGAYASSATLLQEASQGVLSIKNLYRLLAQDKDDTLKKRFEAMDMARSIGRSVLIDADGEKYERIESGAFSGLPDTVDRFMFLLAGASRIPVTILMGQAPAGLNATGDSDVRTFYDRTRTMQISTLKPRLLRLVRLFLLAKEGPADGRLPPTLNVEFAKLYQMTPKEEAELRKLVADTDGVNIERGIVTAEEVAISRFRKEGWSMETQIDLDARKAAMDADADDPAQGDAPGGDHADAAAAVLAKVAAREIPRDAGVALLVSSLGMTPEEAEAVMGETGRSFWTKPDPAHVAELDATRAENAALKRSQTSTKAMLARVLERNRNGELVLGNVIAAEPTDTEAGDVLEEGDVVAVPASGVQDARALLRADGGRGVAVVLPLPAAVAVEMAALGGERPEDLHLTLAYFGDAEGVSPERLAAIRTVVAAWAARAAPLPATLGGIGRFFASEGELDPVYLSVDAPGLISAREALVRALAEAGVAVSHVHGFVPHVTLVYVPQTTGVTLSNNPGQPNAKLTFAEVAVWSGDTREAFPLAATQEGGA